MTYTAGDFHPFIAKGERLGSAVELKPGVVLTEWFVGDKGTTPRYALVNTGVGKSINYNKTIVAYSVTMGEIVRTRYGYRTMRFHFNKVSGELSVPAEGLEFLVEQLKFYVERFA